MTSTVDVPLGVRQRSTLLQRTRLLSNLLRARGRFPGGANGAAFPSDGATPMLTLAVILLVLWLLGLVSSYTIGGMIHILLIAAIVIFLVRAFQGRRPIV